MVTFKFVASTFLLSGVATSFTSPLGQHARKSFLASTAAESAAVEVVTEIKTSYDVVRVDLDEGRDYPIYIGSDFSDEEAAAMIRPHILGKRCLVITNDRIDHWYLDRYQKLLEGDGIQVDTCVIPDGEVNKNMETMGLILDRALELNLDRRVTFVALGGGVIGDMVGFAASVYQRGVNFIQVRCFWLTTNLSGIPFHLSQSHFFH